AIIFLSARDDSPGRLRARIDDCTFSNGVGDAIHIYRNVDAIVRNCSAHDVFRGGVTVTGGNSIVVVDSFRTDGDLHPTGIDVEIDGAGYQGSYAVDIRMTNLNLAGDFDVAVRAGQFYGQHIYCGGSPVYVAGRDGEILIEDSELRYALEDPMKIVVPHRVTFRRCRLVAQGSFETSARVDPGIMVQWNAGGSQRQNNSVTFEDCDFDYKRPAQRNSTRPAAALYNNAGNKDDQNELVFTRCSFSSAYDYGIFLNQGGMLTMDSCTIGGPNGIYVGSSNTQRAYNYRVSIKDMEMKQSGATAVEYKEQERNEIQVTGKSIKLKPVKGLSKTKVKRIEK
ncbi:MAG: right-handed parallel beta-helix repeat-containing protein, partial [Saprospiraceae bacterium]|nr:right-handed parallel beta-helix repeat-containing protein [Saprospiraceae bacterium]